MTLKTFKRVIIDTSCFITLSKIDSLNILNEFYGEVFTTETVAEEYGLKLPIWVVVEATGHLTIKSDLEKMTDKGEASAIALAITSPNSLLVIDDEKGRQVAKKFGINYTGTLGILIQAKKEGRLNSMEEVIEKMKQAGFYISNKLENEILRLVNEKIS